MKRLILFIAVLSLSFGFAEAQSARKLLLSQSSTPPLANSKYGLLYNWYAATGGTFVAGWHLPSNAEWITLRDYLGGVLVAGGRLKEVGFTYWNSPNTGATDDVYFHARGAGYRASNNGIFIENNKYTLIWSSTPYNATNAGHFVFSYNYASGDINEVYNKKTGESIRLICDSSTDPGYVDIDGKRYMTVDINGQIWLAENLQAKHYSDGTPIAEEQNDALWVSRGVLTDKLWCVYNNDDSNR